jgi:hypothetical protein
MSEEYPPAYYELEDGSRVILPSMPILRAGLPIPGPVQRPDGKVVFVKWIEENDRTNAR